MDDLKGCQLPCLPRLSEGPAESRPGSVVKRLKSTFALPWNATVKPNLKRMLRWLDGLRSRNGRAGVTQPARDAPARLQAGDRVRIRSKAEIEATLDRFQELRGCAFLDGMWQYCDTEQRVLVAMERFLDERDYRVKKVRGVVLLEGVYCEGTPVFGRCDRHCHLFWREEWLERVSAAP